MNKQEYDILINLYQNTYVSQRIIAETTNYAVGTVNKALNNLVKSGYLNETMTLTTKARELIVDCSPKRAIILAAGYGMRMVPINMECPKALVEINGEKLIERQIKQLHEVGIMDIYVVVGFMKEEFEYLIDEFGVKLVVNPLYAQKNNIHSLKLVKNYLDNAYIIPCDIWSNNNPFHMYELYSWYMVSEVLSAESTVRINRKFELVKKSEQNMGHSMIGIAYLTKDCADIVRKHITEYCTDYHYDNAFWEECLYEKDKMIVYANIVEGSSVTEINTYEQLREWDRRSNNLKSDAMDVICSALGCEPEAIVNINVLKKGMTNRSFLFSCNGKKYIMRIPGEGTDYLINRKEEAAVYQAIRDKHICDTVVYINPDNGYKITEFLEKARVCDAQNQEDVKRCVQKLRQFHEMELVVPHEFDIFKQIDFYENLWNGATSVYKDYQRTKESVLSLKPFIDRQAKRYVLTHIDAIPDNFLFVNGDIRLIDWEYAGMQDPHVDIAMFCIYALYDKCQVDRLIDIYFEDKCLEETRIKIYCYIAACGLLWSNWCEYKRNLGVEFGEYSLRQYRYAKDYYALVQQLFRKMEVDESCIQ